MNSILSIAIVAAGIVLLIWGLNASESFASDISRIFTGGPTEKTLWMTISGAVLIVVGAGGLFMGRRRV